MQALSVNIRQQTLNLAGSNITRLRSAIDKAKATDAQRLKDEYNRLWSGLAQQGHLPAQNRSPLPGGEDTLANPALPQDILQEAVSAAEHSLCSLLKQLLHTEPQRLHTGSRHTL